MSHLNSPTNGGGSGSSCGGRGHCCGPPRWKCIRRLQYAIWRTNSEGYVIQSNVSSIATSTDSFKHNLLGTDNHQCQVRLHKTWIEGVCYFVTRTVSKSSVHYVVLIIWVTLSLLHDTQIAEIHAKCTGQKFVHAVKTFSAKLDVTWGKLSLLHVHVTCPLVYPDL